MCSSLQIWMSSDSSGKQFQIVVDIHSFLTKANIQHFLLISNICKSYFPCPECPEWSVTSELVADVALTGDDGEWDQRCWVQIMHARCEHSSLFTNCTIQNPRNNAQLLPTLWLSLFRETTKKLNVSFLLEFHQQIFNLRTRARPGLVAWASLRVRNVSLRVLCGRDQTGNWFHPRFFTLHCDWSKAWIFPMNHCWCRWLLPRMIQAGADGVQVLIIAVETLDHSLIIIVEQHVCGGRRKYSSLSCNDIMTIITTTTGIRP